MSSSFQVFINCEWIEFDDFDEDWSLAHALRDRLGLTGTKVACGVGGCGSCTVLVSKYQTSTQKFRHFTVNACITPIYSVYGCHILTIEGLGDSEGKHINPLQDTIARGNGTQCGFCTPGMVMSMAGFQNQTNEELTMSDLKVALQGNLCRCTGYRPILEAFKRCSKMCSDCSEPCSQPKDIEDQGKALSCEKPFHDPQFESLRTTTDFSKKIVDIEKLLVELSDRRNGLKKLKFLAPNVIWLIPRHCKSVVDMIREFPDAKLVSGCTSTEIRNIPKSFTSTPTTIIDLSGISELRTVELKDEYLKLGSGLTIQEMSSEVDNLIKVLPDNQTAILRCLQECISTFGSSQIRNVVTIGGTLAIPTNASDFQTFCKGFDVTVSYLPLSENDHDPMNKQVVSHIEIPLTTKSGLARFAKVSRRKDCDSAILNMTVRHDEEQKLFVTLGGSSIKHFQLRLDISQDNSDHQIIIDDHVRENFMPNTPYKLGYVQVLARSMIKKFGSVENHVRTVNEPSKVIFKSTQLFPTVEDGPMTANDLVHRAVPHASSYKHATGEAKFCDDIPKFHNELELAFVLSTKAHAKIVGIDYSKALDVDGVVGYVSSEDLAKENNKFGLVERDEEIFASDKTTAVGQIIAGILANSRLIAQQAAKMVKIQYEDLKPLILTNEDAISLNSYYEGHGITLKHGNYEDVLSESLTVISGEVKIGSQEHFYMEPQSCIVIPKGEDGEIEIISSTQNPTGVQMQVAQILNIPANRVVVKVKRVGGGFGGKETRCFMIALPAAVAANKFGKPVRCILDRDTDMAITGKRHFYTARHNIVFNDEGRLEALRMSVYANAGNSLDVSMAPIERILLNVDNAYNIPNLDMQGFVCRSNIPSNTVFRGSGGPQAAFIIENIMDTIASTLRKDPVEIRAKQLYKEGDVTPYGQTLLNCTVQQCWDECLRMSKYHEQKLEIAEFNRQNQFVKRGISLNPCHFGVGYTALHLNQGSALVNIYTDGSVLISHGGVEIGQGVHSKMIQVATRELGIPASKIRIVETSTDKVPNTTPSSASCTSDFSGMAVMDACRQLIERLQPYWIKNPDDTWEGLVNKAYMDRVHLSATGFHKVPEMGWDGKKGRPFNYYSSGAACSVVELDCLTGNFQVIKTDIVMDVGKSLNPSIDIGQIEGAFMQGIGLFLLEEVIFNEAGELVTSDLSTYKIPTASDTPLEFNVSLLTGSANPKAIYSSKTVGEPPLLLATSVFFAVKDAIRLYRKSIGADTVFHMDSPATIQSILMACQG